MVKQQIMRHVAGLALLLALLAGMALYTAATVAYAISAPAVHHAMGDVSDPPPGH